MYRCESWTIKKAEHQRTDAFKLWCWRGLLRVPWTARRSNQSILKEINPEYSLEGLMLKLMLRANSLGKTLLLGRNKSRKRRGQQEDEMVGWHHRFNGHELENSGRLWRTGNPGVLQSRGSSGFSFFELFFMEDSSNLSKKLYIVYFLKKFLLSCLSILRVRHDRGTERQYNQMSKANGRISPLCPCWILVTYFWASQVVQW